MNLTEIKYTRESFGGGDGKAINRHSQREYSIEGSDKILVIDRCTDVIPRYFTMWYKPDKNFRGLAKYIHRDFVQKGNGLSWGKFIKLLTALKPGSIA